MSDHLSVAIHKLTSCSGCQLGFINLGSKLLNVMSFVHFTHFIEAGVYDPDTPVDVALVEGSVSTEDDLLRLEQVRKNCRWLVTMGACATSGGVQALRNIADAQAWKASVYASPEFVESLDTCTPVAEHVKVDFELWGCPVTHEQLIQLLQQLRVGVLPKDNSEKVCMACKRSQNVCVMVTHQSPCLGPVVRTGCGALCPSFGRACFGCFGPSGQANTEGVANRFEGLGLQPEAIAQVFAGIHSHQQQHRQQIERWRDIPIKEVK
ncbi:sulfhydrogenase subunit delta [Alteromonas facilis]|uniref:NADH-quinone oxidoreductase subunit B family protein n=1 Tax=Alteromonas facilis TaxID=2048004 RepID=UPI000C28168D|nr:sulfhydrogenase subunit delta [Alteromonas facilis]